MTEPAEHCGHLSPQTLLTTPPVECVLRPGHSGSHASETNMRWYPTPAPVPSPDGVRDQIAAAIGDELDVGGVDALAAADAVLREPAIAEALTAAAAVSRVRHLCASTQNTKQLGYLRKSQDILAALDPQEQP